MAEALNIYRTQIKAVDFLQSCGFKIKKSKFNDDLKRGLISKDENGHFAESSLLAYAVAMLEPKEKERDARAVRAVIDKASADAELKTVQAERQKLKLRAEQGKYIEKEKYEEELAARAQFFKREIETFLYRAAGESIDIVRGDTSKHTELVNYWLSESASWMDAWSQDRDFSVEGDVEDDTEQRDPEISEADIRAEEGVPA